VPRLLRALAQTAGQLCNYSQLGGQIGIDHKTASKYIAIFEQMYLMQRVQPWSGNRLSRLVKTPKLQFLDSGLLGVLLDFSDPLRQRNLFGQLLESFVFAELRKQITWAEGDYALFYYRDKDQYEVDFVVENSAGELIGIEVKASASVSISDLAGLNLWRVLRPSILRPASSSTTEPKPCHWAESMIAPYGPCLSPPSAVAGKCS
jgi:hypothetical protein